MRAAIVVGKGGVSWEITRQLVKNLPVMVTPRWVVTRTQPIALADAVRTDVLTYAEMLRRAARVRNGRPVPIAVLEDAVDAVPVSAAVAVTTVVYAIATTPSGNLMLGLAALVLGTVVGLERRASGGVLAPILTHVTWSTTMLLVLPTLFA